MLIIETINLDSLKLMDSVIFAVGFFISVAFFLFKMFSKVETKEEEQHYYGRHNIPLKENKKKDKIY